jgi:cytoskeletal protein CcmA (bactofilin family)
MVFNRKPEPKPFDLPQDKRTPPSAAETQTAKATEAVNPADAGLVESVIGSDLSIEGQSISIRCKGLLRVNGNIQADLHGRKLIVGDEATITGAISAEAVDVYGKVQGSIEATSVMLRATADVEGDITSRTLSIEPGASFDGRARKLAAAAAATPREPLAMPASLLHS